MSDGFIGRGEFEKTLRQRDWELREHYDGVFNAHMQQLSATEEKVGDQLSAMGEKLSRNIKWLIGAMFVVLSAYATISVTQDLADQDKQLATDRQQTQQILDAWRAIERSAAIVSQHGESSRREFDENGVEIKDLRDQTNERIRELERVMRDHK
jgi:hypothetical protein